MATVDFAAGETTADRTGDGRQLAAITAADLVAHQSADDRAGHGAADVAVAFRGAFLHDHVLADFAWGGRGAGLAHRLGADHLRVQLLLLGDRVDVDHLRIFDATAGRNG